MEKETKLKLIEAGREDLIEAHNVTLSGLAGVLSNGNIVNRVEHPEAVVMPENPSMNIPKPKIINLRAVKAVKNILGEWFFVPNVEYYKFNDMLQDIEVFANTEKSRALEVEFEKLFRKYAINGDLNSVQLYINCE